MTRANLRTALAAEKAAPRRDRPVAVRLSQGEHDRLFAAAKREGIAPSTIARVLLLAGLDELGKGAKAQR